MKTDYFTLLDIFPALLWLIIIIIIGYAVRNANIDKPHYRFYMRNLYAKLFLSLAFALFYIFIGGGGDTVAYYDSALTLNNLFFKSPSLYFQEMVSEPDMFRYTASFDTRTGFPPGWIYREPEAFFVSKLMSLVSFLTLKSYLAMTFIMAFITSIASWKLFELIRNYKMNNEKLLAFGILLMPSVNFWCSGVSKDTVVFIAVLFLIINAFKILSIDQKSSLLNYAVVIVCSFIILYVRSFIFIAFIVPFSFVAISKLVRLAGGGAVTLIILRVMILGGGIIIASGSLISQSEEDFKGSNSLIQEASNIQQDFNQNKTYGDKKYDLGEIEFSPIGLARVAPLVIITGLFRPFIWESFSTTLIMNGLESLIFLYFTFLFFRRGFFKKFKQVRNHDFLLFCLMFTFIIAYMTGLTSILYGVLVRLRAPLLPFLFVLLTVDWNAIKTKKENEIKAQN